MADDRKTGSMIALRLRDADAKRLAVDDGLSPDDLHLTLLFLGDAGQITPEARNQILDHIVNVVGESPAITGEAFAVSVFNPPGFVKSDEKERESCVVLGVGDPNGDITALRDAVEEILNGEPLGFNIPSQHSPWSPHITLMYSEQPDPTQFFDRVGEVTFDGVRVVFGDDEYVVPLGDETDVDETDETNDETDEIDDMLVDVEVDDNGELIVPNTLLDLREYVTAFRKEGKVAVPGVGHNLRNYWLYGPGAAKIRFGTEGSMKRCIRNLRKYVRDPGGLCATYHKVATGEWPRGGVIPSDGDTETFDEVSEITEVQETAGRRRLELAVVMEPDENGECPDGYAEIDGRCVKFSASTELESAAGGMGPGEIEYDTPDVEDDTAEEDDECPPGHHMMPDGECMPDEEMMPDAGEMPSGTVEESITTTSPQSSTWEGILTVEGVESGDGRMFLPGSLTWGDPPLPLMWQKETAHGQGTNTSVRVGSITKIWREDDPNGREGVRIIKGRGIVDVNNPDGAEVLRRMRDGFLQSNSVDVDSVKNADIEMRFPGSDGDDDTGDDDTGDDDTGKRLSALFQRPELTMFKRGRIRGTTLVEFPAFIEAQLALVDDDEEEAYTAGATALATFGVVGRHKTETADGSWDGPANEGRLPSPVPLNTARGMYAFIDETQASDGAVPKSACKLPHHNVNSDGTPGAANLTACSAAIGALNGARGGVKGMSDEQKRGAYAHLAGHLRDADREPPPLAFDVDVSTVIAATHVMKISDTPPREWFDEPTDVEARGALTITDEGRVFGYLAPAGVRHRSFPNRERYTPMGKVDYTRFMGGETIVADGGRVTTGVITMNCGHATTEFDLTTLEAQEHYDNTCSVVASVRVGENDKGVWVAGALLPDIESAQLQRIMNCRLSGDWRPHLDRPGWRELAAALLVPVPGFPMARSAPSVELSDGQLVASSMPVEFTHVPRKTRIAALEGRLNAAVEGAPANGEQPGESDAHNTRKKADDQIVELARRLKTSRVAELRARMKTIALTTESK